MHQVTGTPASRAAHAARPRAGAGLRLIGILAAMVITAIGVAAAVLLKSGGPASNTPTSARLITVTPETTSARP